MFFKRTIAGIAALTTVAAASGITAFAADTNEAAKESGYKESTLNTLVYDPENVQSMDCRYYDALPSIPYVKLSDFYKTWASQELEIKNNNDGSYEVKVPIGTTGTIDVNKDTLHTDDKDYFFGPEDEVTATSPLTDLYCRQDTSEHTPYKFDIDFGKYNIDIIADNDELWFPVPTLCDIWVTDLKNPFYMENTLCFGGDLLDEFSAMYASQTPDHVAYLIESYAENGRPQDLIDYNYNELCFSFDLIYGFPGRPYFTDLLKEKGLDGMLSEGNDTTKKIKELLLSADYAEYSLGFQLLNNYLWDGGHTQFAGLGLASPDVAARVVELVPTFGLTYENSIDYLSDANKKNMSYLGAEEARTAMLEDVDYIQSFDNGDLYCEKNDVAFFSFDSFETDRNLWDIYYHHDGEIPCETVSNFYNCILRADVNPKITKFVIDMGTNGGGDSLVLEYMISLMTDLESIKVYMSSVDDYYEIKGAIDKNLDKVIDNYDKEFKTDLKFGVITSNYSFSCGNLFPSIAHDNGMVLMGEKSGGGACAIQVRMTADGNFYILSSGTCLIDKDNNSIDLGIDPDYNNVVVTEDGTKDFSATYNFENISKYFNEFYKMGAASSETTTSAASETTVTTTATTAVSGESTTAADTKTTDKTSEVSTTAAETTTSAATTTAGQTEKKYFAPLSKIGDYVKADYKEKTGKDAAEAVLKDSKNGTFTVILSDEKGNVLDKYIIDPETGKGKNSKGVDVDLPQTGNNSVKTVAAAAVAVTFMTVGAAAVYASGVGRKKKDNE